jgi:hypothetical protein
VSRVRARSGGPDRRTGRRGALLGLGGYALITALSGVLLVVGFGPGQPAQAGGARPLAVAPVLPGQSSGQSSGTTGVGGARNSGAVPSARLARGTQAGNPFRPELLVLPDGAKASVTSSGLHPDGSLVIPDDPAVVGWWNGGALSGDAFGGVVLAGHVDSARYGLGAMAQLRTLKAGQIVELRAGTRRMQYRVTTRTSLPQAELAARTDAFRQDIPPRLVLITCGGAFDPVRHRYQDNLIIYARPV